jgi:hypothetical protein
MLGILPFIGDENGARGIVLRLLAAVPTGSYLAITHSTGEASGERVIEAVRQWNAVAPAPLYPAQPGADRHVLRGPGTGRARVGAVPAVAAGPGRRR